MRKKQRPANEGNPLVSRTRTIVNVIVLLLCAASCVQVVGLLSTTPPYHAPSAYYDVLHIRSNATTKEIKQARQARSLVTHPDKNPDGTAEEYMLVQEAYETLSDQGQRIKYDCTDFGLRTVEEQRQCWSRALEWRDQEAAMRKARNEESRAKAHQLAAPNETEDIFED